MTGDPLSLLLVEDNPGDVRLLEVALQESEELAGARLSCEATLRGALERLRNGAPDVILLDLHLPDSGGDEAVRLVTGAAPSTPVVVLTGSEDREQARRALRAGVEDYLIKGSLQPSDLERSIRYSRERKQAELTLRRSQARYRALFEDSPDGVLVLDRTGVVIEANDRLREIFGYPLDYLDGEHLETLLPDARSVLRRMEDDPSDGLTSERGSDGGSARAVRQEGRARDGNPVPVEIRLSSVRLPDGHRLLATVRDLTEKRALEREADVLTRAIEDSVSAVALGDLEGRLTYVNPSLLKIWGYDEEELLGRKASVLWEDEGKVEGIIEGLLQGERWQGELVGVRADGRSFTGLVSASVVTDEAGDPEALIGTFVDISERKRAEEALGRSEERFRQMAENIDEVFWLRDPESEEIFYVSPAFEEIWGRPVGDLLSNPRSWIEAIHPEDRDRVSDVVLEERNPEFREEYRVIRPDDEVRWVYDRAFPVRDEDGDLYRVAGVARDVTDQKRMEEKLRHQALHDSLTGLPNRALFEDRVEQALARARRRSGTLAVLMADLNRFKRINDSLGHTAGDRVLEEVGRRLGAAVRRQDTVARWGGDEFCILLTEVDADEGLKRVRDRVMQRIRESVQVMDEPVLVDMTMGAVLVDFADDRETPAVSGWEDLVRYADQALHLAQRRTGESFHLYRGGTDADSGQASQLRREHDLRRGLAAGEIESHYQPIVDLATGRIWGLEPLARWRHAERGLVPPSDFIPIAEETGLIHDLGKLILREACENLALWSREGHEKLQLAVNVSARQFGIDSFTGDVEGILRATGVAPERICFEVTETAIMRATDRIAELRDLGFRIVIDDFGTGYSSFLYLRDLDVDGLKIDMSFVQGLDDGPRNRAIVETILTLGRELDLGVVGEGIETRSQLVRLREMGCQLGQGFYLARPESAENVTACLSRREENGAA